MVVRGDTGAALLFPPRNPEALASAREQLATSPSLRSLQAHRARKIAEPYSWRRTAQITLKTLEQAACRK